MCGTCGCEGEGHHLFVKPRTVRVELDLLAANDRRAKENREWLSGRGVAALNLIGSPGAGKTSLLERTIAELSGRMAIGVVEGDQETDQDAERIRKAGCAVVQINTGTGCHLEADGVRSAIESLELPAGRALVMIENVGNLVCPALFDLGERAKVVVMSVTEGEDKPLKYPHVFRAAEAFVLTKSDLIPHVDTDVAECLSRAKRVNPKLRTFTVSAKTGEGIAAWSDWVGSWTL